MEAKAIFEVSSVLDSAGFQELVKISESSDAPWHDVATLFGRGSAALAAISEVCVESAPEWLKQKMGDLFSDTAVARAPEATVDRKRTRGEFEGECEGDGLTDKKRRTVIDEEEETLAAGSSRPRGPQAKWTKEEEESLSKIVERHGGREWKKIASELGTGKTGPQCSQHFKRVMCPTNKKGSWDDSEESLLMTLHGQYGDRWNFIASMIPRRTDIQCRYQLKRTTASRMVPWSAQEDVALFAIVAMRPSSWIEVSKCLSRNHLTVLPRTALECRQRYESVSQKVS